MTMARRYGQTPDFFQTASVAECPANKRERDNTMKYGKQEGHGVQIRSNQRAYERTKTRGELQNLVAKPGGSEEE